MFRGASMAMHAHTSPNALGGRGLSARDRRRRRGRARPWRPARPAPNLPHATEVLGLGQVIYVSGHAETERYVVRRLPAGSPIVPIQPVAFFAHATLVALCFHLHWAFHRESYQGPDALAREQCM